jgi:glycosyltransferase involved in cell wall biosynthesis
VIALYCPDLPPVPGGVADHTLILARALEALNHAPAVLGWRGDPALFSPLPCRVGVRPLDLAAVAREMGLRAVVVQFVPFLFARRGVSLPLCLGLRRVARAGVAVAIVVHEPYVPFTRLPWLVTGWPMRWQFAYLMRLASRVYAPVPQYRDFALRHVRPGTSVELAPIGATLPVVPISREAARRDLGLDDATVAIGVFSPGAPVFSHDWITAAARRLANRPGVVWLIYGYGSERELSGYPSGSNVRRLGAADAATISRITRALDISAAPYFDGLTMRRSGAMLALAHGIPTVSSTGHQFDATLAELAACEGSADAFAARLERLVDSPAERRELAQRAGRYAEVASVEILARRLADGLEGGR